MPITSKVSTRSGQALTVFASEMYPDCTAPFCVVSFQTTLKRINKEIADLQKEDIGDILLYPQESNIHKWTGWIPGPEDGPYQGGQFELKIDLPADYP